MPEFRRLRGLDEVVVALLAVVLLAVVLLAVPELWLVD
jgi:hypothetical protein